MALDPLHWWTEGLADLRQLWQGSALAVAAAALVGAAVLAQYHRAKYPRGPSRLSAFLGMAVLTENVLEYVKSWRRQFGDVYTLFIGRTRIVFMADYDIIHDVFVRQAEASSSRPIADIDPDIDIADKAFQSPRWKEQRKFAMAVLREHGMGKVDIENKILEETTPFLSEIEKHCGASLNVDAYMHRAISNVICNLILGSRFDYGDPIFVSLLEKFLLQASQFRKMRTLSMMPWLKWLPGDVFGIRSFLCDARANNEFFMKAIRQHEESLDPNNPRDFIDAYLIEVRERAQNGSQSSFDHANCVAMVVQLFIAGTDTTANTLLWAWLFMILHPDIQQRVQNEIDTRIGSRRPSLNDRAAMPFTEAVLTEVLRLGNTTGISLPHLADADVSVGGHVVPKGTVLIAAISSVHLDEATYSNPTEFNPQRFLNSSENFEKPKKFLPFSVGRRACPGESLARAELFLFFTSVLQHFSLSIPEECVVRAEGKTALTHKPLPYQIVFRRRHA